MKITPKVRAAIEQDVLTIMSALDKTGTNTAMLKAWFKIATDDQIVAMSKNGVPIYAPVGGKVNINLASCKPIAKRLGLPLSERLWLTNPITGVTQLTKYPHYVMQIPYRRQTQSWAKKFSVAKHSRQRDHLTSQVTGASKASSFSYQEAFVLFSSDALDNTLDEFIHARGGNEKLERAFYAQLRQQGKGRIKLPGAENTAAKATKTLHSFYKAMLIETGFGRAK